MSPMTGTTLTALDTPDTITRPITVAKGAPGEPDLRRFDNAAINSAIDSAMAALPSGKTVVALARVDLTGARLTIAGKVPGKIPGDLNWTVYVDKPYEGSFDAGVGIRWSI